MSPSRMANAYLKMQNIDHRHPSHHDQAEEVGKSIPDHSSHQVRVDPPVPGVSWQGHGDHL